MVGHRTWVKANSPCWSNHVATWYAGHQSIEEYCSRRDISATSLQRSARHLLSAEELHKRKKGLQNSRIEKLDRQDKKAPSKPTRMAYTYLYNTRTDRTNRCPGVLGHARGGYELERHAQRRGARPAALRAADLAQSLRGFRRGDGLAIVASSECPGAIKQRC